MQSALRFQNENFLCKIDETFLFLLNFKSTILAEKTVEHADS